MKRAKKAPPPAAPRTRVARPVVVVLLTLGVAAALLFGLSWLGDEARRNIGPRDRYAVRFADIRCDAPSGSTRETFLVEVRYMSNFPQTFQSMDAQLQPRLTAAFAAHPWVASVDSVAVSPPDVVSVALTFRKPVLAIPTSDGPRAVDAKGILLPKSAPTAGLSKLLTPVAAPGKAGEPWPGDTVIRAARVAATYKPRTISSVAQGWELIQHNGQTLRVGP